MWKREGKEAKQGFLEYQFCSFLWPRMKKVGEWRSWQYAKIQYCSVACPIERHWEDFPGFYPPRHPDGTGYFFFFFGTKNSNQFWKSFFCQLFSDTFIAPPKAIGLISFWFWRWSRWWIHRQMDRQGDEQREP